MGFFCSRARSSRHSFSDHLFFFPFLCKPFAHLACKTYVIFCITLTLVILNLWAGPHNHINSISNSAQTDVCPTKKIRLASKTVAVSFYFHCRLCFASKTTNQPPPSPIVFNIIGVARVLLRRANCRPQKYSRTPNQHTQVQPHWINYSSLIFTHEIISRPKSKRK